MPVRGTRFGSPKRSDFQRRERVRIFQPDRGLHSGAAPHELSPGFSPDMENFVTSGSALHPRSGLSSYEGGDTGLGGAALGGMEAVDEAGTWYAVVASDRTVAYLPAVNPAWTPLTYSGDDAPSGDSRSYWDMDYVYSSVFNENLAVLTNAHNAPKYFELSPEADTLSDFTFVFSLVSTAKSVAVVDDRLVFFNVKADDQQHPTRIVWTPRGIPTSDLLIQGAGFDNLLAMKGIGQKIITDEEGAILFSDREVWRIRPRRDFFAFDPFPLRGPACPFPNTAVTTPHGVIYLAADLEVYIISGSVIAPLGPIEQGQRSRIQTKLRRELKEPERAWALYNTKDRRYELHYKTSDEDYPRRALYFDFETNSWTPQRFAPELSFGFPFSDPDGLSNILWENVEGTWEDQGGERWLDYVLDRTPLEERHTLAFSSSGTAYRLRSDQTTDDGEAIECRWRSHGLSVRRDPVGFSVLDEVWIDYEAPSASSASVYVSEDGGSTFGNPFAFSFRSSAHSIDLIPVRAEARAPQFEIRLNDGGTPRINRFEARVRDEGRLGGGF